MTLSAFVGVCVVGFLPSLLVCKADSLREGNLPRKHSKSPVQQLELSHGSCRLQPQHIFCGANIVSLGRVCVENEFGGCADTMISKLFGEWPCKPTYQLRDAACCLPADPAKAYFLLVQCVPKWVSGGLPRHRPWARLDPSLVAELM